MHCHGIFQTKEERKREREGPHAFSILPRRRILQSPGDYLLWLLKMKAMGTRRASLMRAPNTTPLILNLLLLAFSSCLVVSFASKDSDSLIKFKGSLSNVGEALRSWDPSTEPCAANWTGVVCSKENILTLQLENMNLAGKINVDSLIPLRQLRTLDLMNNKFEGPMPDFKKLGDLKFLFLSNNQFSGVIPDDAFAGMENLKKVYLSNNKFSGIIPSSLVALSKLSEVRLDDNQFEGQIPEFKQQELKQLNVSNNQLEGPIPDSLANMDQNLFSGNKAAKTPPAPPAPTKTPATPAATKTPATPAATKTPATPAADASKDSKTPSKDAKDAKPAGKDGKDSDSSKAAGGAAASKAAAGADKKKSPMTGIIIAIVVVIVVVVIAVVVVMYMKQNKKEKEQQPAAAPAHEQRSLGTLPKSDAELGKGSPERAGSSKGSRRGENAKLSFIREDREKFELQDLLKASAEVLGSGNFGSSYKALLNNGAAMVVKRFKQMDAIEREEFYEHMRRLGRLTHPNLLSLVAYYYRKEEKLLVYDYVHNRSLANQLHGTRHVEQVKLDWPIRLKIVQGVAKALAYLHNELPTLSLPHGHLKSSNVLLNDSLEPLLMDYTLVPMINLEKAQQILVAYKSPDYVQQGKVTRKTDVWCLGILILETLTGKSPAKCLGQAAVGTSKDGASDENLSSWISSIKEDSIDEKMGDLSKGKGEIKKLLKIGKTCCEENVEKRLELKEIVEKIEGVKEKDSTDHKDSPDAAKEPKVKEQSDAAKEPKVKEQSDAAKVDEKGW